MHAAKAAHAAAFRFANVAAMPLLLIPLLLLALVAGRIAFGIWQGWERWHATQASEWLAWQAGLFALGGLLLGHALATAWGLRARFRRWRRGNR